MGPPLPESYQKSGDWPIGGCWTQDKSCKDLGIKDHLCGRCGLTCVLEIVCLRFTCVLVGLCTQYVFTFCGVC